MQHRVDLTAGEGIEAHFFAKVKKPGGIGRRIYLGPDKSVAKKSPPLPLIDRDENLATVNLPDKARHGP